MKKNFSAHNLLPVATLKPSTTAFTFLLPHILGKSVTKYKKEIGFSCFYQAFSHL